MTNKQYKEEKYSPYKNCDELLEDALFYSGSPVIWVKDNTNYRYMITTLYEDAVSVNGMTISLIDLFKNFTYLDGSTIGVKE